MRKGMTLIEVIVALGIFSVIATVAVGAFILVLNLKALTSTTKETQQKLRTAIEIISRLSRQANEVPTPTLSGKELVLYFDNPGGRLGTRFKIETFGGKNTLTQADCTDWDTTNGTNCSTWATQKDLLEGPITLDSSSRFEISGTNVALTTAPPSLSIILNGTISVNSNAYYSNTFNIDNKVIFESIK